MEFDIKPYVVKDCSSNFDNMIQQVRSVKDGVGRVRRNISINSALQQISGHPFATPRIIWKHSSKNWHLWKTAWMLR